MLLRASDASAARKLVERENRRRSSRSDRSRRGRGHRRRRRANAGSRTRTAALRPLRRLRLLAGGRRRRAARRHASPASGQAVGDHQVDLVPRREAVREPGVIAPPAAPHPPAVPHARLDIHRTGRVAIPMRMSVRIREAADRHLALSPTPAARSPARCEAPHVRPGQRAAHAARSASKSGFSPVQPTSIHATNSQPGAVDRTDQRLLMTHHRQVVASLCRRTHAARSDAGAGRRRRRRP